MSKKTLKSELRKNQQKYKRELDKITQRNNYSTEVKSK